MDALKVFAANLKKYRKDRGLSQEAFSDLEIDTYRLFIDTPNTRYFKSMEGSDCVNVNNSKHN